MFFTDRVFYFTISFFLVLVVLSTTNAHAQTFKMPLPPSGIALPITNDDANLKKLMFPITATASVKTDSFISDTTPALPIDTNRLPAPLRANHVAPSPIIKIRWLLFQIPERSANTGQLTCLGWARSINIAKFLESEGPFNAAVASASISENVDMGSFWNNAGEASLGPLASKWDIPIWSQAPANSPLSALSALYGFSKATKGSANIAIAWDAEYLDTFQALWLEGLVKSGDLNGMQAMSSKQRIRKWTTSEKSRLDVMEYIVENGTIKNLQWRTFNMRLAGLTYGCPES